jgi:hypothetical protein
MKLPIRTQQVLGPAERVVRLTVFCPGQRRTVEYAACCACPALTSPGSPKEAGACIECTGGREPRASNESSLEANTTVPEWEPIGAVSDPCVLCIRATLPADRLPSAFRDAPGMELPVVDARGRLLGTVWRDDFLHTRSRGELRPALAQRTALDSVTGGNRIHEGSCVKHALELLVSKRARTLVLVRDDDSVGGLVTDLDLLRWLTRERRRHSHR